MLDQLLDVLAPKPTGEDRFTAKNMHPQAFRVYGGQVLAQCVSAAVATVDAGRVLHSQHAYFLRPGDPAKDIEFEIERARDGWSFSSRRVVALQDGKPILVSSLSFQAESNGDDYQPDMIQVPPPESLPSERQLSHEAFRADDWLLHTVEAERIVGVRGLARGSFFTREGRLVATTMQQGVMRFR